MFCLCPGSKKSCPVSGKGNADTNRACPVSGKKGTSTSVTYASGKGMDLSSVRADLAQALRCKGHDDGTLAPLFIRFTWHCCGTFDAETGKGGSNGCTMRFQAEQSDPENAGLAKAREVLLEVHEKHPYISLADVHVLAGYVALEHTGGPIIPFATGRKDFSEEEAKDVYGPSLCPFGHGVHNPSGSLLPAADLGTDLNCAASSPAHERERPTIEATRGTFQRMGLSDKETVALIVMGHQYGRMHDAVSGYGGVTGSDTWYAFDPNSWNVYGPGGLGYLTTYSMQAAQGCWPEWVNPRNGKRQFHMRMGGGVFAFLPVDMALLWDPTWRSIVLDYDRHRLDFHRDSAVAWKKLTELGCDNLLVPEATKGHNSILIDHIL